MVGQRAALLAGVEELLLLGLLGGQDGHGRDAHDVAFQSLAQLLVLQDDVQELVPGDIVEAAGDGALDLVVEDDVEADFLAQPEDDVADIGVLELGAVALARVLLHGVVDRQGGVFAGLGLGFRLGRSVFGFGRRGRLDGRRGRCRRLGGRVLRKGLGFRTDRSVSAVAGLRLGRGDGGGGGGRTGAEADPQPVGRGGQRERPGLGQVEDQAGDGVGIAGHELPDPDGFDAIAAQRALFGRPDVVGVEDVDDEPEGVVQGEDVGQGGPAQAGRDFETPVLLAEGGGPKLGRGPGRAGQGLLDLGRDGIGPASALDLLQLDDECPRFRGDPVRDFLGQGQDQDGAGVGQGFGPQPVQQGLAARNAGRLGPAAGAELEPQLGGGDGRGVGCLEQGGRDRRPQDDAGGHGGGDDGDGVHRGRRLGPGGQERQQQHGRAGEPNESPFHVIAPPR